MARFCIDVDYIESTIDFLYISCIIMQNNLPELSMSLRRVLQ